MPDAKAQQDIVDAPIDGRCSQEHVQFAVVHIHPFAGEAAWDHQQAEHHAIGCQRMKFRLAAGVSGGVGFGPVQGFTQAFLGDKKTRLCRVQ